MSRFDYILAAITGNLNQMIGKYNVIYQVTVSKKLIYWISMFFEISKFE